MVLIEKISSPKLKGSNGRSGHPRFYDFYAGYSSSFALDVIRNLGPPPGSIVLDPWNGSGTTTFAAWRLGLGAVGLDINPAMTLIAKARLASQSRLKYLDRLAKQLRISDLEISKQHSQIDALTQWFDPATAARFRALQKRLGLDPSRQPSIPTYVESLSNNECLMYVSLFRLVRHLTRKFESSNPTWVRLAKSAQERLSCPTAELLTAFRDVINKTPWPTTPIAPDVRTAITIICADARNIQTRVREPVQCIVTSPPYCTRIDYAVTTRRELAILSLSDGSEFRDLRAESMGTPLMISNDRTVSELWGPTCLRFLERVRTHGSKASATYYFKTHLQYFDSLYAVLDHCFPLLSDGGRCAIVVQGSYYKGILNDLPQIVVEMVAGHDALHFRSMIEFRAPSRYRHNPHARKRHSLSATAEHVLFFEKQS